MPMTVILAHLVYGVILGLATRRYVRDEGWLLGRDDILILTMKIP